MRIRPITSFPHPVLAESTGDYGDRKFDLELDLVENPAAGGVLLAGAAALDDVFVQRAVKSGQARVGLMVTCQDTYLDRFVECSIGEIKLDLSGGQVRGTVFIRGVVVATQDGLILNSEKIDAEFPEAARVVNAGEVVAFSPELSFEAGLEKLAPLESIFRLLQSDETPEGQFEVGLESEAIEILVPSSLYEVLYNLRQQSFLKDLLLPSLYLPVVMTVLEAMREDDFSGRRWYGVMNARCGSEGIDVKNLDDLAGAAQRLLDGPLSVLKEVIEKGGR